MPNKYFKNKMSHNQSHQSILTPQYNNLNSNKTIIHIKKNLGGLGDFLRGVNFIGTNCKK